VRYGDLGAGVAAIFAVPAFARRVWVSQISAPALLLTGAALAVAGLRESTGASQATFAQQEATPGALFNLRAESALTLPVGTNFLGVINTDALEATEAVQATYELGLS